MNTEDSEFARIEREQAMRNVPDAIHHTDTSEPLMYIQGWNDCRASMLAAQPAPVQQEPFGYFKAEPFGWTNCAETDDGAIALYTAPQAQPARELLTDEQIADYLGDEYHIMTEEELRFFKLGEQAAHNIKEKS